MQEVTKYFIEVYFDASKEKDIHLYTLSNKMKLPFLD